MAYKDNQHITVRVSILFAGMVSTASAGRLKAAPPVAASTERPVLQTQSESGSAIGQGLLSRRSFGLQGICFPGAELRPSCLRWTSKSSPDCCHWQSVDSGIQT